MDIRGGTGHGVQMELTVAQRADVLGQGGTRAWNTFSEDFQFLSKTLSPYWENLLFQCEPMPWGLSPRHLKLWEAPITVGIGQGQNLPFLVLQVQWPLLLAASR